MSRKLLALILSLLMVFSIALAEPASEVPEVHTIEEKSFPLYLERSETVFNEAFPLFFLDGVGDLPYVRLSDIVALFNGMFQLQGLEISLFTLEYDPEENAEVITNSANGSQAVFGYSDHTVFYPSFDTFANAPGENPIDIVGSRGFNPNTGLPELFGRINNPLMSRAGNPVFISLEDYGIRFVQQDGQRLVPLHTAFDLLVGMPLNGCNMWFNGQAIFVGSGEMLGDPDVVLTEYGKMYFSVAKQTRSPELCRYGLGELCMELDNFYGLKNSHQIHSFVGMLLNTDFMPALLSENPAMADLALATILYGYMDDGHSAYNANSWMTGPDPLELAGGLSMIRRRHIQEKYEKAAEPYQEILRKPYYEVGNTAYVFFPEFYIDPEIDYYKDLEKADLTKDTVALVIYAHQQIFRENSPIENVVIDLTFNPGGIMDAGAFMLGWCLGVAPYSVQNTLNDALVTSLYRADVNLDRQFDEKDTLDGKNVYCLISPLSFSCANLVAWMFKTSGDVTLIGDTSGGGSCTVLPMTTAWGTSFQLSGCWRMSYVKNGSFYDVDQGVNPDVVITRCETLFDREKMTKIINGLN